MGEPKILPPSMRPPKRYIVFEILSEEPVKYGDFVSAIWSSVINFLGEFTTSKAGIWIIQNMYEKDSQRGVIKCNHDFVEEIRTSLSLISMIGEIKSIVKILGITGTLKSAKSKYLSTKDLSNYSKP